VLYKSNKTLTINDLDHEGENIILIKFCRSYRNEIMFLLFKFILGLAEIKTEHVA
jgi:hypothetical protein